MKYENVGFIEAIKIVADKIGYNLNIGNLSDFTSQNKEDYEITDFAQKYYLNNIFTKDGIAARKYLEERGIDEAIIKEFNIGVALDSKDTLYKLLTNKKYSLPPAPRLARRMELLREQVADMVAEKGEYVALTQFLFHKRLICCKYTQSPH